MIEPLFSTIDELEVLARLSGSEKTDAHSIVQSTFQSLGGKDFNKFLSDGLLENSSFDAVDAKAAPEKLLSVVSGLSAAHQSLSASNLEVRFKPSSHAGDGRSANNGWMMECPDPMTKLTWDNPILISPRLAKELEADSGISIFPGSKPMNESNAFFEGAKGTQQLNKAQFEKGKESAVLAVLTIGGRTVKAPVHVQPGLANYTIELPLGMGRSHSGRVGNGVGFDYYPLRESTLAGYATGATLTLTKERHLLANTQEHWSMEGRAIIREANASYYVKQPDFANKMGVESHAPSNYGKYDKKSLQEKSQFNYRGNSAYEHPTFADPDSNVKVWQGNEDKFPKTQQWGMAIDLNSCFGCSACVVACQSENNIPIVGKDQVLRGREMHWMRLDRYFSAQDYDQSEVPEDVQVSFMGMLCQHCENAPCESVCPVNATVHDKQGLNVMAYNRCVGTRYCANNCAYKVRRFNFFDWNKRQIGEFYKGPFGAVDEPETQKMQKNPNVSIRMRGVMEKCTFCTQRIEAAKIEQKRLAGASADIAVKDGAIKTACQQVCPTDAITFGDIADPDSEVSKAKASDRNYSVLGYLNSRPARLISPVCAIRISTCRTTTKNLSPTRNTKSVTGMAPVTTRTARHTTATRIPRLIAIPTTMATITENSTNDPAQAVLLAKVQPAELVEQPLVTNNRDFNWVTDKICRIVETPTPLWWWVCMAVALLTASFTGLGLAWLVSTGVGVWGLANPINWGWAIVNFVFWIGIGHAGTLISAVLCLLKQGWRTSINRAAEAMTIFAVVCAGIFPLFHVGRVWFAWWLFPAAQRQCNLAAVPLAFGVGRFLRFRLTVRYPSSSGTWA